MNSLLIDYQSPEPVAKLQFCNWLIDETNFDDVLSTVRQAYAMRAITRMHLAAAKGGLDKMSLEDINAEIAAARKM